MRASTRPSLLSLIALVSVSCGDPSGPDLTSPFASISAGLIHTCGVTTAGEAYCWGWNERGQVGDGSTDDRKEPFLVRAEDVTFTEISAGGGHTCALADDGAAWCWGFNENGQLGAGPSPNRSTPVPVSGGLSFTQISASQSLHTCGVTTSQEVYCWGWNAFGQLGNGASGADEPTPVAVSGGLDFTVVSAGTFHTCGLTPAGEAYCWGQNENGELGDGTTDESGAPVLVTGGLTFQAIEAGFGHTCGLTTTGQAYCWGQGSLGQLATGGTPIREVTPMPVMGGLTFASLAVGSVFTCGVTAGNAAHCWGSNGSGQLGAQTTETCSAPNSPVEVPCSFEPLAVTGELQFERVDAGNSHTCGITVDDEAYCWGRSSNGQLGDGRSGDDVITTEPVRVANQL